MKEGVEKRSELEDVEWEIFIGLCEYAYTRDYVFTLPTRSTLEEDWVGFIFNYRPSAAVPFARANFP